MALSHCPDCKGIREFTRNQYGEWRCNNCDCFLIQSFNQAGRADLEKSEQ